MSVPGAPALVSIVVPVYYNAETLRPLYDRICSAIGTVPLADLELVFVDDASGDDSNAVLRELAAADPRVRVLHLSRNFGSNAAVLAGLSIAQGDCVATIAADLQDPPELLPELVSLWRQGHEVVLAARRRRADPFVPRLLSAVFNRLFRRLAFRDFPPGGFDFMLIGRRVADLLVHLRERNSYLFGQVLWVGFRRAVVTYDRQARPAGRSRWTTTGKIKYFIDAFTAFSYVPLRFTSTIGLLLAGLGLLAALVILVQNVTAGAPLVGVPLVVVVVLITSGVQLIMVGIIGEYLWRVLDDTRARPAFIIDTAVNVAPDVLAAAARSPGASV